MLGDVGLARHEGGGDEAVARGGGGGTASLRVGTQYKTTDPRFCATTALSQCP